MTENPFPLSKNLLLLDLNTQHAEWILNKGPLISLCWIISVECPKNLNFPLLTSNQNKGSPKQPISMKYGSKFVRHSTEIIQQSKIKGPLEYYTLAIPELKHFERGAVAGQFCRSSFSASFCLLCVDCKICLGKQGNTVTKETSPV